MSILSGYGKYKRYILTDEGYKLCSHWTSSNTVEFDDGNTAETKVGSINGISDSLTANNSNVALSTAGGFNLQSQIDELNTNLNLKLNSDKIFTVTGYLNNTSASNTFSLGKTYGTAPYLLSAQIQLSSGVWSDMRKNDNITRIDNNASQVNVIKNTASALANYMVRFVFLAV